MDERRVYGNVRVQLKQRAVVRAAASILHTREHGRGTTAEGKFENRVFLYPSLCFSLLSRSYGPSLRIAASYVPFRASFPSPFRESNHVHAGVPRISFHGDFITIRLIPVVVRCRASAANFDRAARPRRYLSWKRCCKGNSDSTCPSRFTIARPLNCRSFKC